MASLKIPDWALLDAGWVDDNQHVCVVAQSPGHGPDAGLGRLWIAQANGPARLVRGVGQIGSAPAVMACSVSTNRAVIASERNVHIPPPPGARFVITVHIQV